MRATKVAPTCKAIAARSTALSLLIRPRFDLEPRSAVAENWPLVSPYTPLFSTMYTMFTPRRSACTNWPIPIEAESPSPEMPR